MSPDGGFEQGGIGSVFFEHIVGGDDAVVGFSQKHLAPKLGIRSRFTPLLFFHPLSLKGEGVKEPARRPSRTLAGEGEVLKLSVVNTRHREAGAELPDFVPHLLPNIRVLDISDYLHNQ